MDYQNGLLHVYRKLERGTRLVETLHVSEWADRYRQVTSDQSSIPGQWMTSRNPPLKEIMDCLSKHSVVHEIVIKKSSQVGVTEAMINGIGYIIDRDPGPIMVLLPTEQKRDEWKSQKFNPLIEHTEAVKKTIGELKSRDAASRKDRVEFPGGFASLVGGNSPSSYDQVSIRVLFMDDLDRFPEVIGKGQDPVERGRGRTKAFPYKYKFVLASTPTIEGISLIDREWINSDQRRYHVHCPACHTPQTLQWKYIQYDKTHGRPTTAWMVCHECGFQIMEHHKQQLLENGLWIPTNPGHKRRGYHINALYIPLGLGPSWLDLATKWYEIHHDPVSGARRTAEPSQLMSFINEDLGEVWQDQTSTVKTSHLEKRKDEFKNNELPPGVLALTIAIDTQDTWLDVQVIGWREWHEGRQAWRVVDWIQIMGDTSKIQPWNELEAIINKQWTNAFGHALRPKAAAIDNRGHRGEHVRAFVARDSLKIPVYRVQGSTRIMDDFISQTAKDPQRSRGGKVTAGAFGIWNIGTEAVKDMIYGALYSDSESPPDERRIHFSADLPTEYFNGLLSEVKNPKTHRYEQKRGAEFKRNEPLDGFVYGVAIGYHKEVMIGIKRRRLFRQGGHSVMMMVPHPPYWELLRQVLENEKPIIEQADQVEEKRPAQSAQPVRQARKPTRNLIR